MKKNKLFLVLPVTIILLAFLFFYFRPREEPSPCDAIIKQTADRLRSSLILFKQEGGISIGEEKIQDLSSDAQIVGMTLKTCCILRMQGKLTAEEFLKCKMADEYQNCVNELEKNVNDFKQLKKEGDKVNTEETRKKVKILIDSLDGQKKRVDNPPLSISKPETNNIQSAFILPDPPHVLPDTPKTVLKEPIPESKPKPKEEVRDNPDTKKTETTEKKPDVITDTRFYFMDLFEDNRNHWPLDSTEYKTTKIINNKFYLINRVGGGIISAFRDFDIDFSKDFVIETELKLISSTSRFGVVWGASNENNMLTFNIFPLNGTVNIWQYDDAKYIPLVNLKSSSIDPRSNILQIEHLGADLKFYINRELVKTMPYEKEFGKKCGFISHDSGQIGATYFKVTGTKK